MKEGALAVCFVAETYYLTETPQKKKGLLFTVPEPTVHLGREGRGISRNKQEGVGHSESLVKKRRKIHTIASFPFSFYSVQDTW